MKGLYIEKRGVIWYNYKMQNLPSGQAKSELEQGQNLLEGVLHVLPQELLGVMPESVWGGLTLDQKKDVLRQNNLLEKYDTPLQNPVLEVSSETGEFSAPSVAVEHIEPTEVVRSPEFKEVLENIQESEKNQETLNAEEKERISQESLISQSTGKASWSAKVFGYVISDDTVNRSETISQEGGLDDGKTWVSTLVRKMLVALGQ